MTKNELDNLYGTFNTLIETEMKTRLVIFTCLAAVVWACNSPKTQLEEFKAERDSLKKELAEVEKEIL
jgi:hypothetical protein